MGTTLLAGQVCRGHQVTRMTYYCPNCSAELSQDARTCGNCHAIFDETSGWHPVSKPVGPFRKFSEPKLPGSSPKIESKPSPLGTFISRFVIGLVVLFFAGIVLIVGAALKGGRFDGALVLWLIGLVGVVIWASSTLGQPPARHKDSEKKEANLP